MRECGCYSTTTPARSRRPCRPRHPYAVPRTLFQCVCTRRRNCIGQLSPCLEYAPTAGRFKRDQGCFVPTQECAGATETTQPLSHQPQTAKTHHSASPSHSLACRNLSRAANVLLSSDLSEPCPKLLIRILSWCSRGHSTWPGPGTFCLVVSRSRRTSLGPRGKLPSANGKRWSDRRRGLSGGRCLAPDLAYRRVARLRKQNHYRSRVPCDGGRSPGFVKPLRLTSCCSLASPVPCADMITRGDYE